MGFAAEAAAGGAQVRGSELRKEPDRVEEIRFPRSVRAQDDEEGGDVKGDVLEGLEAVYLDPGQHGLIGM